MAERDQTTDFYMDPDKRNSGGKIKSYQYLEKNEFAEGKEIQFLTVILLYLAQVLASDLNIFVVDTNQIQMQFLLSMKEEI